MRFNKKSLFLASLIAAKIRTSSTLPRGRLIFDEQLRRSSRVAGTEVEIAEAHHFYKDNYNVIAFYEMRRGQRKTYIGSKTNPRTCRFCNSSAPKASFSQEAHAVSHMVGNRTLFLNEECDECNAKSAQIENDFGNFTLPERTWSQVPGKKGIPTLRSFAKSSRVEMTPEGLSIKQVIGDDIVDFDPDKSKGSFTATATLHKYRPLAVYKALLKMALSIMDHKELHAFGPALQWIASQGIIEGRVSDITQFTCFRSFTSGLAPYAFPVALLLRRKSDQLKCPYMSFVLIFHNYTYQIFLPSNEKDKQLVGLRSNLPMWPHPYMLKPRGHYRTNRAGPISLAAAEYVERKQHTIRMRFDSFATSGGTK